MNSLYTKITFGKQNNKRKWRLVGRLSIFYDDL